MLTTLVKTGVLLFVVLALAGCVEEDSITINSDGLVRFDSLVGIADDEKKLEFSAVEKIVSDAAGELRQAKWTVESTWVSKERPYSFRLTGSGNLHDVAARTKFYLLTPVTNDFYRVKFPVPKAGGAVGTRRIIFAADPSKNAQIHDLRGGRITEIDGVADEDVYTIRLREPLGGR